MSLVKSTLNQCRWRGLVKEWFLSLETWIVCVPFKGWMGNTKYLSAFERGMLVGANIRKVFLMFGIVSVYGSMTVIVVGFCCYNNVRFRVHNFASRFLVVYSSFQLILSILGKQPVCVFYLARSTLGNVREKTRSAASLLLYLWKILCLWNCDSPSYKMFSPPSHWTSNRSPHVVFVLSMFCDHSQLAWEMSITHLKTCFWPRTDQCYTFPLYCTLFLTFHHTHSVAI